MLTRLELAYHATATQLAEEPEQASMLRPWFGFFARLAAASFAMPGETGSGGTPASVRAVQLSDSMANLEYAIKTHETFKSWFAGWLKFHIVISFILYGLLALHVWAAIYFGLRWFE
jgi:hypothetical protein